MKYHKFILRYIHDLELEISFYILRPYRMFALLLVIRRSRNDFPQIIRGLPDSTCHLQDMAG